MQDKLESLLREHLKGKLAEECHQYLKEAFNEAREFLFQQWRESPPEKWGEIKAVLTALELIEGVILRDIGSGQVADSLLKKEVKGDA